MSRWSILTVCALALSAGFVNAASLTGDYLEARTCDVWTGPCFANAEMNLAGKNAVMAWRIDKGSVDQVNLDGLGIVAIVASSDTLGLEQTGPAKSVLIVDSKASKAQREALVRLAKKQGGALLQNVIAIESAKVDLTLCNCKGEVCAKLQAGGALVETRCLDGHDKVCGNESAFYPPLVKGVKVKAAVASEHSYVGQAFRATWRDTERRGAYVGSFEIK